DRQTDLLGGFEIDHKLELGGLLDWKIGGLGALQELIHVSGRAAPHFSKVRRIRHEPTNLNKIPTIIHCGNSSLGGEVYDALLMDPAHQRISYGHESVAAISGHHGECPVNILRTSHLPRLNNQAQRVSRGLNLL